MANENNSFWWLVCLGVAGYLLYSRSIIVGTQTTPAGVTPVVPNVSDFEEILLPLPAGHWFTPELPKPYYDHQ